MDCNVLMDRYPDAKTRLQVATLCLLIGGCDYNNGKRGRHTQTMPS